MRNGGREVEEKQVGMHRRGGEVCNRSGTRRGMRFFIRTHLREQVGKGKEEIKDAAIAKVHAYISGAPSLCSITEEEFFIKS